MNLDTVPGAASAAPDVSDDSDRLPDEPAPTEPSAAPDPEGADDDPDDESGDAGDTADGGTDDDQKPKRSRPGKYQRQLMRQAAQIEALQGTVQQLLGGLARPDKGQSPPSGDATALTPPREADFSDYAEYLKATARFEARREFAEQERRMRAQADAAKSGEAAQAFRDRVEEARAKHDDFEEVAFNPAVPISPAMAEAIRDSDQGPEIAYWLGKNPGEARRIAALGPLAAARELGRLEGRLTQPPTKKPTAAPPPPRVVAPTGTPTRDPSKMDYEEYKAWRMRKAAKK